MGVRVCVCVCVCVCVSICLSVHWLCASDDQTGGVMAWWRLNWQMDRFDHAKTWHGNSLADFQVWSCRVMAWCPAGTKGQPFFLATCCQKAKYDSWNPFKGFHKVSNDLGQSLLQVRLESSQRFAVLIRRCVDLRPSEGPTRSPLFQWEEQSRTGQPEFDHLSWSSITRRADRAIWESRNKECDFFLATESVNKAALD